MLCGEWRVRRKIRTEGKVKAKEEGRGPGVNCAADGRLPEPRATGQWMHGRQRGDSRWKNPGGTEGGRAAWPTMMQAQCPSACLQVWVMQVSVSREGGNIS